jgi:teichuronic acid exporter
MSIKKEMFHGVMWSAIEKYSGVFISLIISAILARLISPEEFGVVAIASVLINFLSIFTDMGIGPAIIQRKDLSEQNLNSIFTFTILGGIFLSCLFYASATPIATFYSNTKLIIICKVLSINLLFAALNIVPHATILKEKKFKFMAKRTLLLQVASGIFSIYVAFKGGGLYALLISPIVTAIGMFFFNIKYHPRTIDIKFDSSPFKKIYSFSIYQFLFSFMNYFSRNIDSLIIGRYFTLRELGYYDKSYRLMMLPLQNVTNVITPVMQPILSSLQNDVALLASKYNQIIKLIATISFPLSVFLFFTGSELIRIVYGENWNEAIPVFKIFALSLSLQMILSTSGAIYQSANATKYMFINGVSNTFCTVTGFLIAAVLFKNIIAMAWAWNISLCINMVVSYFILYKIVLKSSIYFMIKSFIIPIITALSIGIGLYFIDELLSIPFIYVFVVKFCISLLLFVVITQSTKHYDLLKLLNFKKNL